ncbi:hypothetical protein A8F94_01315 [Bacillus sp. FJAT-27225]|uniref:hypothetical protein n=1 Tax=Bacillus sp. FJAT-27225 TaxID=1743144 RepID=UPI00080C2EAD|nr:hypothetical protein [Bacillus sp. FJAT-27225]OCA90551.1 hypothetical protein A8F94_01315 [Bacillus sp. FJAT-27225]
MKKYILPGLIMIISIFFLNTVIDKPEEEEKPAEKTEAAASTQPAVRLSSPKDSKPMVLLNDEIADPSGLKAKTIKDAIKKAKAVDANPFDQLMPNFPATPSSVVFYEWQADSELLSQPVGVEFHLAPREPGEKVIILSAEWPDGKKGIYLSKINVKRLSSYQHLLAPDTDRLTVLGFFEPEYDYTIPSSPYETYIKREVKGTAEELRSNYQDLPLDMLPVFFVFQNDTIMFQTEDFIELTAFLTKETTSVFKGESDNWEVRITTKDTLGQSMMETVIKYKGRNAEPKGEFEMDLNTETSTWGTIGLTLDNQKEASILSTMTGITGKHMENKEYEVSVRWDGKEEKFKVHLTDKN